MMNNQQTFYQYAIGDYGINGLEGERQYNKTMAMVDNVLKQALTQEEAVQFLTRKLKKYMWDLNRQRRHYSQTMLGLAAHDLTDSLTTNDCHMVAIRLLTDNSDYVKLGESTVNNHVTLYRVIWGTEGYLPDNQDSDTIFTDIQDAIEYAEDYINDYLYDLTGDLWNVTDEADMKKLSDMLGINVTKGLIRLTGAYVYRINYLGGLWKHKLPHYVEVHEIE